LTVPAARRLRFYLGNAYRFATIPWRQRVIAPEEACTIFACSYGDDGWQHLRRTLAEYDRDPGIGVAQTTLCRFLSDFTPRSICELLQPPPARCTLPLFVYPWGTFRRGETVRTKDARTSRFCGPSSAEFIAEEFARVIALYRRMKEQGYRPWTFGHTFIGGTFLVARDGKRRFVVLQGNHRMAVLSHLGQRRIAVRDIGAGYVREVREQDLSRWPLVRDGRCAPEVAHAIFRLFFERTGWHVARALEREPNGTSKRGQPCGSGL
jgi:hypothetical protein